MLTAAALFILLPLGIAVGTWLGDRLGAKAPLLLLPPFPVVVMHLLRGWQNGEEALITGAGASLASLPMVFTWAVPFFWAAGALRALRPVQAGLGALVVACIAAPTLQWLLAPLKQALETPWVAAAASLPLLLMGHLLLRLPEQEQQVRPARASLGNLAGRIGSLLLILFTLWGTATATEGPAMWVHIVVRSVPRMTLEFSVSVAVVSGVVAARQVLWGLPIGLVGAVGWCLSLVVLTEPAGAGVAIAVGLIWTVLWWGLCWRYSPWRNDQRSSRAARTADWR